MTKKPKIAATLLVYEDTEWLLQALEGIYRAVDAIFILINDRSWFGAIADTGVVDATLSRFADPEGKVVILRHSWPDEVSERNFALGYAHREGFDYIMVVDADEIYVPDQLAAIVDHVRAHPEIDCWHVRWFTYWKSPRYRIDPIEPADPCMFLKIGSGAFCEARNIIAASHALVPVELGLCHHLSYARSDEQILRKISSFSHAPEIAADWFERVWKGWDRDHSLRNLHPVNPPQYERAVEQNPALIPPSLRSWCDAPSPLSGDIEFAPPSIRVD